MVRAMPGVRLLCWALCTVGALRLPGRSRAAAGVAQLCKACSGCSIDVKGAALPIVRVPQNAALFHGERSAGSGSEANLPNRNAMWFADTEEIACRYTRQAAMYRNTRCGQSVLQYNTSRELKLVDFSKEETFNALRAILGLPPRSISNAVTAATLDAGAHTGFLAKLAHRMFPPPDEVNFFDVLDYKWRPTRIQRFNVTVADLAEGLVPVDEAGRLALGRVNDAFCDTHGLPSQSWIKKIESVDRTVLWEDFQCFGRTAGPSMAEFAGMEHLTVTFDTPKRSMESELDVGVQVMEYLRSLNGVDGYYSPELPWVGGTRGMFHKEIGLLKPATALKFERVVETVPCFSKEGAEIK